MPRRSFGAPTSLRGSGFPSSLSALAGRPVPFGAVFPTSNSPKINRRLGTRHRAALGLAEETDAICIVVSEETGRVSIALKGDMLYNLTLDDVKMLLIDELKPKQEIEFDEDEELNEEEIYEEDR